MSRRKQSYYNSEYLNNIFKLVKERKYHKALEQYKIYLENYPFDLSANVNFAHLLVKLGFLEDAKNILEKVKSFSNYPSNYQTFINQILLNIFCAEGKYDSASLFLQDHPEIVDKAHTEVSLLFIGKQLNKEISVSRSTYLIEQVKEYSENAFFERMKKPQQPLNMESSFLF